METPNSSITEATQTSGKISRKAGILPSLKDVRRSWRTHVGFDFWAEGNKLVDHLGI